MKDERLRVTIDDAYLHAVGLATICFARLEWDAAWCCEKMQAGYLNSVGAKTAGQIANDLVVLAGEHPDLKVVASLGPPAAEYRRLVENEMTLCIPILELHPMAISVCFGKDRNGPST